ncbi:MAG: hypothetical protein J5636_06435 [Clostridiales bacterium]|nr:hypothetical protein [Clostridiales bacterium]
MNGKDMLEWMNDLDDKAVVDADVTPVRVKKHNVWKIGLSVAAGVLVLALLSYVLYPYITGRKNNKPGASNSDDTFFSETDILKSYVMASPNYPTSSSITSSGEKYEEYAEYNKEIVRKVLADTAGQNKAFSPLCMYLSLSMVAEVTDGESRQQILDILHQPDIESVRACAKNIFLSNYMVSENAKCLLANSFWTNSGWTYDQSVMETLASEYFASSFTGDPNDPDYSRVYREWLRDQTDGLLDGNSDSGLDPQMVLSLLSVVNFSGNWTQPFISPEQMVFHGTSGDVTTTFVQSVDTVKTYTGEHFISASARLDGNGSVRFILPEEGMTPEQLLEDEELFAYMNERFPDWDPVEPSESDPEIAAGACIRMPMIDFTNEINMKDYLTEMGVTDVFDASCSDFSPLKAGKGELAINSIKQNVRVMIDDTGCKAIAVTEVLVGGGDPLFEKEVLLDRPYIFEIVSESGLPLFIGIVNNVK